jgi:hypothetical protein
MLRRLFHDESRLSVGGIAHIQELSTPDFGTVPAFGNIGLLSVSNNLPFAPFHSVPLFLLRRVKFGSSPKSVRRYFFGPPSNPISTRSSAKQPTDPVQKYLRQSDLNRPRKNVITNKYAESLRL